MSLHIGAPELKHMGKLVWPFSEDEVTAAYELVRAAGVRGRLAAGFELPDWWWVATDLQASPDAKWHIDIARTEDGEAVVLTDEGPQPVRTQLARALGAAKPLDVEAYQAIHAASAAEPRASDFPLGAHVIASRHDAVLLERLALGDGAIVSWTTIGAGTGPGEFARMQQAHGAYHVVMVAHAGGRTVGIWYGPEKPANGDPVRPVLRRLFKRGDAWRYGVGFAPTL